MSDKPAPPPPPDYGEIKQADINGMPWVHVTPPPARLSDEECAICGPHRHDEHADDSYGSCVLCRKYVPHTDDDTVKVAWPCPAARLAAKDAEIAALKAEVERLRAALEKGPHGYKCRCTMTVTAGEDGSCDCWKSGIAREALEGKP